MTSAESRVPSPGPGESPVTATGGSAPAHRPGVWGPLSELEMWKNSAEAVAHLLEHGHTSTALFTLNDLLRQMTIAMEREVQPPEDVQRALGALRVIVRDLPAWKSATVKLFLHGVRPTDLRNLSMSQCRLVVWDLASTLSTLEKGGRA